MERRTQARGFEFEHIVAEILHSIGFADMRLDAPLEAYEGRLLGPRADIIGRYRDRRVVIEVKHFRSPDVRVELLRSGIDQLLRYTEPSAWAARLFVVSALVPPALREGLTDENGVLLLDGLDLLVLASKDAGLLHRLSRTLDWGWEEWARSIRDDRPGESILQRLDAWAEASSSEQHQRPIQGLAERPAWYDVHPTCETLRNLPKGKRAWSAYEKRCEDILEYLFGEELGQPHRQRISADGLYRYDLIYRLSPVSRFWHFVADRCGSPYVLFECKNYRERIGQAEILSTEKYLFERAMRRVAIILSRNGEKDSAAAMRRGAMRESGKLILVLTDDDLCEMLDIRTANEEPSDYLFAMADDFLITLSR